MPAEAPSIPDFALTRIANRRRKVQNDILIARGFSNQVLDAEAFTALVTLCRKELKLKKATEFALRETLMPFANKEVTERVAEELSLRLAGGYHLLRNGQPILPYNGVTTPTWMPVEILSVRYGKISQRGTHVLADVVVMIMAGEGVGQIIKQVMPMKFVTTLFASRLGWPRFEQRPNHAELTRMWFMALVESGRRKDEITQYECASHQLKYNKALRKARMQPCIRGYRLRCYLCPLGYVQCERGTHRCSWITKPCPSCKKDALFDPEEPNQRSCLSCRTKKARRHWVRERKGG
jgi:hypothetical protein